MKVFSGSLFLIWTLLGFTAMGTPIWNFTVFGSVVSLLVFSAICLLAERKN